MENKAICLGIIVGDFIGKPVEDIPEKGKLVLTDRTELHIGGCASNTGVVLRRMGVEVSVMGKVGDDNLGNFLLGKLMEEKIDVSRVRKSVSKTTSGTLVMVHSDGERSFIHSTGANGDLKLEDIDFDYMKNFPLLHVAGAFLMPGFDGKPLAETLKKARDMGLITCLDTAWDSTGKWKELIEESLQYIDYFLPSIEEAKMISKKENPEDIAEFFLDSGVKNVCLKMSSEGSYICNRKEKYRIIAPDMQRIDTTGCGDAYAAGFIAGIIKGMPFEKCGMLANITGGKIATAVGATTAVLSYEDTIEFGRKYNRWF
ncbi:MAG TPA: sugar kinase [bacterium]|nr:sugar kinase [bacterium]